MLLVDIRRFWAGPSGQDEVYKFISTVHAQLQHTHESLLVISHKSHIPLYFMEGFKIEVILNSLKDLQDGMYISLYGTDCVHKRSGCQFLFAQKSSRKK